MRIAYKHKLVAQLGEQGFYPFPGFSKRWKEGLTILLVVSVRHIQTDIGGFKEVPLHVGADIAPVSKHGAVGVIGIDVMQIIDVVRACLRQTKGVYDTTLPTNGVQFVSIIVCALRSAVSVRQGFPVITLPHLAMSGTCHAANFYRLGAMQKFLTLPLHGFRFSNSHAGYAHRD